MQAQGAQDAFNAIMQMVDEVFIQAESHFHSLKNASGEKSKKSIKCSKSSSKSKLKQSPISSENDCSPKPSVNNLKNGKCSKSEKKLKCSKTRHLKTKSYRSLDKKKAIFVTSLKSDKPIEDGEVREIEQMVGRLVQNDSSILEL